MAKRAIILAGGKSTRLRPYTVVLPKPLMPIGEYPILEVIVRQLIKAGFDHITMAVNHQANLIKAFLKLTSLEPNRSMMMVQILRYSPASKSLSWV